MLQFPGFCIFPTHLARDQVPNPWRSKKHMKTLTGQLAAAGVPIRPYLRKIPSRTPTATQQKSPRMASRKFAFTAAPSPLIPFGIAGPPYSRSPRPRDVLPRCAAAGTCACMPFPLISVDIHKDFIPQQSERSKDNRPVIWGGRTRSHSPCQAARQVVATGVGPTGEPSVSRPMLSSTFRGVPGCASTPAQSAAFWRPPVRVVGLKFRRTSARATASRRFGGGRRIQRRSKA